LVAKCVIFNWRDSLQKDKLLDQLGVMVHSAQSVELNENANTGGGGGGEAKPFGHLHIVFRDWSYDGDKVFTYLYQKCEGTTQRHKNILKKNNKCFFFFFSLFEINK
jgi:hypothetical protein